MEQKNAIAEKLEKFYKLSKKDNGEYVGKIEHLTKKDFSSEDKYKLYRTHIANGLRQFTLATHVDGETVGQYRNKGREHLNKAVRLVEDEMGASFTRTVVTKSLVRVWTQTGVLATLKMNYSDGTQKATEKSVTSLKNQLEIAMGQVYGNIATVDKVDERANNSKFITPETPAPETPAPETPAPETPAPEQAAD